MTLPTPFAVVKPMLGDPICIFDPTLAKAAKDEAEKGIRARLPGDKKDTTLQIEL
jgi:hypothetical protein